MLKNATGQLERAAEQATPCDTSELLTVENAIAWCCGPLDPMLSEKARADEVERISTHIHALIAGGVLSLRNKYPRW